MTTLEEEGVVTLELTCRKCGTVTVVYALGWSAMPELDSYVGSCCRVYFSSSTSNGGGE